MVEPAPGELDADSLERVLQLVFDSGLLRGVHTARLVNRSWSNAVNARSRRLYQVSNRGEPADLVALLEKTPYITCLDVGYSRITPTAYRQLSQLQLQELCLTDCADLTIPDLARLSCLTTLRILKLFGVQATASAALEHCGSLLRLHTLELRGFRHIDEQKVTALRPLTKLQTLAVVAEDSSNAILRALCLHLLPSCVSNLTRLELGKVESTYPLAALRELAQLKVLCFANCKPFLTPDHTGHDMLVEVAHITQLSSLMLRRFAPKSVQQA